MKKFIKSYPDVNLLVYIYSCACYLSMVISGVAMTWPSPLTAWYSSEDSEVPMTKHEVSWMVSLVAIGAGIASIPSCMLADKFGRKTILLATGLSSAISWSLIMMFRSKWILYCAQLLGGLVVGGAPSVAPIYVSEISPPKERGAIVGQLNTMYFVGQLIVYAVGPQLSYSNYIWVCSAMPVIFFVTFMFAPETPYYLLSKGRLNEARTCMERLRGKESLVELEEAQRQIHEKQSDEDTSIWYILKTNKNHLKNLIYLQILSMANQMNGTAAVAVYAEEFIGGQWVTLMMGITYVIASFFGSFLADPFGRRPLLIGSLLGSAVSMAFVTVYFYTFEKVLLYIGIVSFCIVTSIGINPFVMTLPAELFPTTLRGLANGSSTLSSNVMTFVSLKIFVAVADSPLKMQGNFIIYVIVSLVGAVFGGLLPETANTTIGSV